MNNSKAIHIFVPVFAFQLSNELPLLFVHIKVDAPVRDPLQDAQKYLFNHIKFSILCMENKATLTHLCAVSLCQFGRIAGDQFVLLILPVGTGHTTDTHREQRNQPVIDSNFH